EFGGHESVEHADIRFGVKPVSDTALIGHHDHKQTRFVQPADGLDSARDPLELVAAVDVAAVDVDGAIAVEEDRAIHRVHVCNPRFVKPNSTTSAPRSRRACWTASRLSNPQKKNANPPPPAPDIFPPSAPASRAAAYIASIPGVEMRCDIAFFALHASCSSAPNVSNAPASRASRIA